MSPPCRRLRAALGSLWLTSSIALAGCGPSTYNVRAARAYANEDADPAVIGDRATDLTRAVELADELLCATPYSPGDLWVRRLRLDDDEGDTLTDRIGAAPPYSGQYEVPLAKIYRVKIEEALRGAKAPREPPARFPSLLDAVSALAPDAKGLPATWRAIATAKRELVAEQQRIDALSAGLPPGAPDPPEVSGAKLRAVQREGALAVAQQGILDAAAAIRAAGPRQGEEAILARDLLDALSFALRMDIEALAVAPYVVQQARRVARSDPGYGPNVDRARALSAVIEEERAALEQLTDALTVPADRPLSEAAGYELHEGLLAQAAAINLDALHLKLRGDADLLFFHGIASASASGGKNDRTGRTRRLEYDVDPVLMIGARAILTYDFAHVRNAASLNAGFKTNRLFSQGGDISYDSSLGKLLGLQGAASDFFDIGADLLGFNTTVKFATFTSGEVSEIAVDPQTDRDTGVVSKAPFQLQYHQADVGFDLTKIFPEEAEDLYVEAFLIRFRYMDYELPRIFYELGQKDPGNDSLYVLARQSPAQSVKSVFYQGGFTLRLGDGEWPRLSPFADLGLYGGAGPVSYYFASDPTTGGGTRSAQDATMLAVSGNASLGLRLRLTSFRSRPRFVTEISYNAEAVGQGIISSIRGIQKGEKTSYVVDRKVDLGGFDLFHGPRLLAVLVF